MTRFLLNLALVFSAVASHVYGADHARTFTFQRENVLGTSMEVFVTAESETVAISVEKSISAEIERLSSLLSTWSPESEISRWISTPGTPQRVSPELFAVLAALDQWEQRSQGAFNARVGSLSALWSAAEKKQTVPSPEEIATVVATLARPAWKLDTAAGTAEFTGSGRITVDALAKGYIIDCAGERALASHAGVSGLLLNIGGDLRLWGNASRTIAIANPKADAENAPPLATARLSASALATSGNYRRGWTISGRHYSHILDPRTGHPSDAIASASVIAPDATTADALATLFSILSPAESLRIAGPLPGVEFLLVTHEGQVIPSPGWPDARPTTDHLATLNPLPIGAKSDSMELLVHFELPRQPKRPYVAIWIEDKDDFPVRTLLLWIQQDREGLKWLRDLRRWVRSDKLRRIADDVDLVPVVSAATRRAGNYSVVWDGLDDNKEPLPPGAYSLYIEAVREDGTHQSMKHTFNVGGAPFTTELTGNVEVRSASLDYHAKSTSK